MRKLKGITFFVIVVLSFSIVSGCLKSEPVTSNEPKVLRILGDEWTVNENGSYFEITQDNVEIELNDISKIYQEASNNSSDGQSSINPEDKIKGIITGPNPPDVIYLNSMEIGKYVEDGLLTPLDSFIEKDKFDLEGIVPSLVEGIRELGNGSIFALSPTFNSRALFYNKTLFDKKNIPYPEDRMSWDQIFNLARQLTFEENDKKIYGFAFEPYFDSFSQMDLYVKPLNLSIFNPDYTSLTVNTPEWENVWNKLVQLNKDGVIPPVFDPRKEMESGQPISYLDRQPFLGGKAAMAIGDYNQARQLADAMKGNIFYGDNREQPEKFEWDIVTLPIHPEIGDVGGEFSMYNMVAINASSDKQDLAWKYISFINGDKMAKVQAKRSWELTSRIEYVQQPEGLTINLEAFTALKPAKNTSTSDFMKIYPKHSPWEISSIGNQLFEEVLQDKKTVQEALAEYQTKGQEALDRIINEQSEQTSN